MMLCKYPIHLESAGGIVGCGRCLHCRKNRRRKKTTRLVLESKAHEDILFVTLTYSDEFLPREIYDPVTGQILASHPLGCLDKRAIQLFLKRLRKSLPPRSLRYFVAGEYGEKRGRPHYHLVLFGLPYARRSLIYDAWCDPHTGRLMADPDRIDVQIPSSSWNVSQYCCSYLVKQMTRQGDKRLDGRPPEFASHSKGLGAQSVPVLAKVLQSISGQVSIQMTGDIPRTLIMEGKKMPIDRYLREKILDALQILEPAKALGLQKFQTEMSSLRSRAFANPEISKDWLVDPKRLGWALEKQFVEENASRMALAERKGELYNSTKGDF